MTSLSEAIEAITNRSAFQLAADAECGSPDDLESPGAKFLTYVRDRVLDEFEIGQSDEDSAHEIADGAPDVYTHKMWSEFVDLQAYQEDPTDLGYDGSDMEQAGRVCLYMIAERLALVLIGELREASED